VAIGNAVWDYDFSSSRRSRQGTADGQRICGPARLILVFRPLKTATQPPPIQGSEHHYLD